MNLQEILALLSKNSSVELGTVLQLLEGAPVQIPIKPSVIPVMGKELTMALTTDAILLQIK